VAVVLAVEPSDVETTDLSADVGPNDATLYVFTLIELKVGAGYFFSTLVTDVTGMGLGDTLGEAVISDWNRLVELASDAVEGATKQEMNNTTKDVE
jgi:hypothetical protein